MAKTGGDRQRRSDRLFSWRPAQIRFAQKTKRKDCCAFGNIVRNEEVPKAMTDAFEADPNEPLAERLLRALAARDAAGVEFRQIKSAALMVVH